MYDDRRQHPRFPILLVAMAHTSEASFEVVCTNVSAGGAFLATRMVVSLGAPIELELLPHGPEGPTVMLLAQVRYLVARGGGGQPGFSVTWSEAACATSRLALEQVLRDVLRVPRFRVVADGLGGRYRFGDLFLDDEPEPPVRVAFPPQQVATTSEPVAEASEAWDAPWPAAPAGADEGEAADYTTQSGDALPDADGYAQPASEEAVNVFAGLAISDVVPDDSWADTAMDGDVGDTFADPEAGNEAETVELSVALAAALARELVQSAPPPTDTEAVRAFSVGAFDDPSFDWSDFDSGEPASEEVTDATASLVDEDATVEVDVARLRLADPAVAFARESTSPAASFQVNEDAVSADAGPEDFGFEPPKAPKEPVDDDYFPEYIPDPEPVQRITRNTALRRLSGGFEPGKPAQPSARVQPEAKKSGETAAVRAGGDATQTFPSGRTSAPIGRSVLAKVAVASQEVPAVVEGFTAGIPASDGESRTEAYSSQDIANYRAAVSRSTDEMHADGVFNPDLYAPKASAPRPRPPTRTQADQSDARGGKPMAMVDAGQEVPRVMTESTVAYTRESHAVGPLLHAQTWPIEGEWPEMIPPSLAERYGHLEHIGTGGNGVAFRALDLHLNRWVVLKFLAQSALSTELARKYFLREVKLAASLNHPNIVHIYDIGKVDDVLYYAMEYVDGVPLSSYLPPRDPVGDWQFLYAVMAQLCDALDHAHAQQILHRDIKPDNVLVAVDGVVKLFDFGLARVADEGFGEQSVLIGTPHYMAPEQLMGGRVDHRTDIYALGVMVFRLVTGVLPFQDGNVFAAHAVEPVPDPRMFNPALPAAIVPVIEKAMAKQAANRYNTARELAHDLYAALFGAPLA